MTDERDRDAIDADAQKAARMQSMQSAMAAAIATAQAKPRPFATAREADWQAAVDAAEAVALAKEEAAFRAGWRSGFLTPGGITQDDAWAAYRGRK